jgi:hypothetical protein
MSGPSRNVETIYSMLNVDQRAHHFLERRVGLDLNGQRSVLIFPGSDRFVGNTEVIHSEAGYTDSSPVGTDVGFP